MKNKWISRILAGLLLLSALTITACKGDGDGTLPDTSAVTDAETTASATEIPSEDDAEATAEIPTEEATPSGTQSVTEPDTQPVTEPETEPDTRLDTEAVTLPETESEPETEPETEPPIEIAVPDYQDIGLIDKLKGVDDRLELDYPFASMEEPLSAIRTDSTLQFTSNGDFVKDGNGITATKDVWNAVGFGQVMDQPYVAEAVLYNHGDSTSATSTVMFGTRLKTAGNLFIDSGLWVTVNNANAHLVIHQVISLKLNGLPSFNAKEGVSVRFEDSGEEIRIVLADTHVATVKIDGEANTVTVFDAAGSELKSAKADKLAYGESLGYVRAMQHFANSSIASIQVTAGELKEYAPADMTLELRDGYSYLLSGKTQYKCGYPITFKDGVVLMDAEAVAVLLGFDYAETDTAAILSRDGCTLTFTAGTATVVLDTLTRSFPTVVKRGDTYLIAMDYVARWMGYTAKTEGDSLYLTNDETQLTEEAKKEMKDYYQLYQDVIYNYDDVEADQTGVGLYEKTPYEDRLVGIAYTTWHTSARKWGKGTGTWDIPLDGPYLSDDRDVIYKHGILLRDAGVDFIFVDWTNNTNYDPVTMREQRADFRMIEEATDLLFEIWSTIEGAPKICIFAGPGHAGPENVENGNHRKKVDQIYRDYVEKYPDLYFQYEGKPLLMCYGATPNLYGSRPTWKDDRFTIRWVTGYVGQQSNLFDAKNLRSRSFWSWEERGAQTFTTVGDRVECITCTAASRQQAKEGEPGYIPAYGRENGLTLKKQFQRANDLGAGIVILVSWNEWTTGEQPSPEISKDLEPSEIHGTFYYDLLCEQIKKYKGQIETEK